MTQEMEQWLADLIRLTDEDEETKLTEKQAKILEAAIEIFSEKGYSATSTSEIAQRAGVAEGTIFRHYKTKKDLLLSIVGPVVAKLAAPFFIRDFIKLLDTPYNRFEDFVKVIARDRLAFMRKNQKLLKVFIQEVPFHPELRQQVQQVFIDQVYVRVEKIIRHFQVNGQIIELPPWRVVRTMVSVVVGMGLTQVFFAPENAVDDEQEIDETIRLIMHGIAKQPE